jgi:choline transporter-like protein 2/4/5
MAYVFFHLLWQMQFLIYFTFIVIAGAAANWYFAAWKDESQTEKLRGDGMADGTALSHAPVLSSVKRTLLYHMGTIAFAALIIAV